MATHLYAPASDIITVVSYISSLASVEINFVVPRYHSNEVGVPPSVEALQVKLRVSPPLSSEPAGQPEIVGVKGGTES
jgi:hypothetical protein